MRTHLSSLTSSSPLSRTLPTPPSSSTHKRFQPKPVSRRAPSIQIRSSGSPKPPEKIGSPAPPWDVLPPVNPFAGGVAPLFDFQLRGGSGSAGIPFSLRLVQLRKKRMASPRPTSADLGPVGNAISSLAFIVEELQRSVLPSPNEEDDASRDAGDSVVWLFWKVFSSSPGLVAGLLVLVSEFLVTALDREVTDALAAATAIRKPKETAAHEVVDDMCSRLSTLKIREYLRWSDIGILDESETSRLDGCELDYRRRRKAYEQAIVVEKPNSLILSNYAQLLYQYEGDLDRADEYFQWALSVGPKDAEVVSRYAMLLWCGRGELERAEEMFLEAIQMEPESVYHRSNYAWFLWKTGGTDTCYPLGSGDGHGDEEL